MTEQKSSKAPKIRFKGFEAEWEDKPIGEVLAEKKRPVVLADHQKYELITVKRRNEGVVSRGHLFGRDILVKNYSQLQTGDFVISKRQVVHGATGMIPPKLDGAIVSNEYLVAVNSGELLTEFLTILSSLPDMRQKFFLSSYGVDIEKLFFDAEDWKKRDVTIPGIPEQTRIGEYFRALDNLIGLHQRKHDKLVTLKKAMLQKMFPQPRATTPEIRFKGFEEAWEEDDFGKRVTFFSGLTYSPSSVVGPSGILVLRSSNVKGGEVVDADNVYVDSAAVNCDNVREGDLVVVVRNGSRSLIGKHARITKPMPCTVIGAFMTGIRNENSSFINALLDSTKFSKEIEKNMGATINQITTGAFKAMRFAFPSSPEQKKIGTYFRTLDTLITQHATQLQKLRQIKSACLEKMFV